MLITQTVNVGQDFGASGGVVTRTLETEGKKFSPGTRLSAEMTSKWPLRSRIALSSAGKVRFFTPEAQAPVPEQRPVADEADIDPNLGQFGGITLTPLRTGGMDFPAGVRLPADMVLAWPIKNRYALQETGRVAYFKEDAPRTRATLTKSEEAALQALLR